MENNQDILARLETHSRRQLLFTKVLCVLCAAVLVVCLVLTLSITGAVAQLLELADQAQAVMEDLGSVTQALAGADLGSMVETMNTLAADSQAVVTEAMEKLDTIDIATLNKAIQDLADIVEPLAKVSNFFG